MIRRNAARCFVVAAAGLVLQSVSMAVAADGGYERRVDETLTQLKAAGHSRSYVFALWTGIAVLCGAGALGGFYFFDGSPPEYVAVAQGIAAGAMLAMIADTMIPEAFNEDHDASGLITAAGFVAAFLLSHAFG